MAMMMPKNLLISGMHDRLPFSLILAHSTNRLEAGFSAGPVVWPDARAPAGTRPAAPR
jgi:hypothetical protein